MLWKSFFLVVFPVACMGQSAKPPEFAEVKIPAGVYLDSDGTTTRIEALLMQRTDVTVSAWQACVAQGACSAAPLERDEQKGRCNGIHGRLDHPLNCVTWTEAATFCEWGGGRLPTATEWAYAASGGEPGKRYPWGNQDVDGTRANFCDVNCSRSLGTDGKNLDAWRKRGWITESADDGWSATSPAGSYPEGASSWGLLDMAGNVWQWTSTQAAMGKREVRGGSWDNPPPSLEIGKRLPWPETGADAGMGFRCVRGGSQNPQPN